MRKDSNELLMDSNSLWLVDERLAFHNYLASDKTLNSMPITGDTTTKKPDLCVLNVYDNPILDFRIAKIAIGFDNGYGNKAPNAKRCQIRRRKRPY